MTLADDLFLHEDMSRPENRVNIALFGLMQQDWFREWLLTKLNLPIDAVVYPPKNWNGARPDLKVAGFDGSTLAWIEVELGSNATQAEDYKRRYDEPIKTVWGRQSHGGDLSLDEVAVRLDSQTGLPAQTAINVQHVIELIREGLTRFSSSPGRASVSGEMRNHPLVVALSDRLRDKLQFDLGSRAPFVGHLKADTTNTPNNQGFSLRVRSPLTKTVSLLNISGRTGLETVNFPSTGWLEHYLPNLYKDVHTYVSLLFDTGLDISGTGHHGGSLPLDDVLGRIDAVAECALALANHPPR